MITLIMSTKTYLALENEAAGESLTFAQGRNIEFDDSMDYGSIVVVQGGNNILRLN